MRRFAAERVVFYWEEAIPCDHPIPYLEYHPFPADKMIALRPRVPHWWGAAAREKALAELLAMLIATSVRTTPVLWFYTPMMFGIARQVKAQTIVYDAWTNCRPFASPTPCCSNAKPN
ncbi:hypothetical protein PMI02_04851 [Novosphingobium sp. AP12]|nr:hypothetical protein PMI02_04851 [Novosphingobium sp. AP12]